jgi:peptidoglycan/xylan/chitin deacetylase (PgdA/CDA1 family)
VSAGCSDAPRIALTFDDGPNPPYTSAILDILRGRDARATFFDEGQQSDRYPDIVRREAAEGHAVGSHSYAHSPDLPTMAPPAFRNDLEQAAHVLVAILGWEPALYRSPYGHTSNSMLVELGAAGYTSIGWDLDSTDWKTTSTDEDIVRAVLEGAHPGSIVLLHDGGLGGGSPDRTATVAALPLIIDGLRAAGYEMVTIPELTGLPLTQSQPHEGKLCLAS